jgi:hypothetical protein
MKPAVWGIKFSTESHIDLLFCMFVADSIWKDICDCVHELHQQGFFIYVISYLLV